MIRGIVVFYKIQTKTWKLLIAGSTALIILVIGGIYGFVGFGSTPGLALAILVLLGVVPFLIGVIIQRMFCFVRLPSYVSWILGTGAVLLYLLTQGKILINVLENTLVSFVVSLVLYGIFIDAGVNAYNDFKERKEVKNLDSGI